MKKLTTYFLCAALLFGSVPFSVSANAAEMPQDEVAAGDKTNETPSDRVAIPVENNTGLKPGIEFNKNYTSLPSTFTASTDFWYESGTRMLELREESKTRTLENTAVTLWCDVDSSGGVDISDVTMIQKVLANNDVELTAPLSETAEIDMDGGLSIDDATTLQRMLASCQMQQFMPGDLDRDGKMDYTDIISLYKYLNNQELLLDMKAITNARAKNYLMDKYLEDIKCDITRADFDCNGVVNCDDVYTFINQFNIHDIPCGDVNQDNIIDGVDLNIIKEYIVGAVKEGSPMLTPKAMWLADYDENRKVDIEDVHFFQKMYAGINGFESPNTSWITEEYIKKDKEIRSKYDIYAMYNKFGKTDIKFDDVIRDRPYFFNVVHSTGDTTDLICRLLNVDRFGNVCRLDPNGNSKFVGFIDNRDVRISPTYPGGHKFTGYAARAVDRLGVWESQRKYCMGTSNVLFLFMDCRPLNISDMSFGASETGAAGAKKAIFMPNATDTKMNSEGLMFPTNLLANDSIEYAVFPKNVKGLAGMACNIKPYEGTVDDPNNSYYYDDDAKGINVKHFSDIFAPEVVKISAKQNWPKLKNLVLPARIKGAGQGAFQCLNSFSLEKSSFTGNKEKEYEIVFLSQEHVKLNDDKYVWGDIPPVEVWPIIDVYDENWDETYRVRGASANVNVFCFESSGVGKFFNYYFKSGPGNRLVTYPCSDKYGYVPIYL